MNKTIPGNKLSGKQIFKKENKKAPMLQSLEKFKYDYILKHSRKHNSGHPFSIVI